VELAVKEDLQIVLKIRIISILKIVFETIINEIKGRTGIVVTFGDIFKKLRETFTIKLSYLLIEFNYS
jgi:hypothetical protein